MAMLALATVAGALPFPDTAEWARGSSLGLQPSDTGICLQNREPQLTAVSKVYIIVDVSGWESSQIASMIIAILLSEHIGYNVVFNYGDLSHKLRRLLIPLDDWNRPATEAKENPWIWGPDSQDRRAKVGATVSALSGAGASFAILNMEAWNMDHGDGDDLIRGGYIKGSPTGYTGQSGFFVPSTLANPASSSCPTVGNVYVSYRNLSGEPPEAWVEQGFKQEQMVKCSDPSLGVCVPESGKSTDVACRTWCPDRTRDTIPVLAVDPTYDAGYNEEIIFNNGLDLSLAYFSTEHDEKVEELYRSSAKPPGPVVFYSWTPSTLLHRLRMVSTGSEDFEVSRMFVPTTACHGSHSSLGPPDSKFRCDFPVQNLKKLTDANFESLAPFAAEFINHFKLSQGEIEGMMETLVRQDFKHQGVDRQRQLIFDVACKWVREGCQNCTEAAFNWTAYQRETVWYASVVDNLIFGGLTSTYISVALVLAILVERCLISSTLDLKHFLCNLFLPFKTAMRMERVGSATHLPGEEDEYVQKEGSVPCDELDCRLMVPSSLSPRSGQLSDGHFLSSEDSNKTQSKPEARRAQVCAENVWCSETDGDVKIGVFLSSASENKVSIGYKTQDGTAKAGQRYEGCKGELVFEPNELVKCVDIKLMDSEDWDHGTFFDFSLERRGELRVGRRWKTRVAIIDTDAFPKSRHTSDEARKGMSKRGALREHLRNERMRLKHYYWVVFARLYIAAHKTLVMALLQKEMLDSAVGNTRKEVNYALVLILGCLMFLFQCSFRVAEHVVAKYSKEAGVTAELRVQLFHKLWMISSLTCNTQLHQPQWIIAAMHHAEDVAKGGWIAVFDLIELATTLFLSVILTILLVTDFGGEPLRITSMVPILMLVSLLPVSWWLVILVRKPGQEKNQEDLILRSMRWYERFSWLLMEGKDLVRLGRGRSSAYLERKRKLFVSEVAEWCSTYVRNGLYKLDSKWITVWMTTILTVVFFIFGSLLLIERKHYGQGNMTTGAFVALLGNYLRFGKALTQIFTVLVKRENAALSLHAISKLLNSPTEEVAHKKRLEACKQYYMPDFNCMQNQDHIKFHDVSFSYADSGLLLEHFEAELPLGKIVCIKDSSSGDNFSGGQVTMMRLLAGDLMPTNGQALMPPHLRVGIIETIPTLAEDSLLQNVMFLAADSTDTRENQAWRLAQLLGIRLGPEAQGQHAIPSTAFITMTARVLIADPDVIIVLTSRWQGGPWLKTLMSGLRRWQREGLQALVGVNDPKDRQRSRTLLLTVDEVGLDMIEADECLEIHHARHGGVTRMVSDAASTTPTQSQEGMMAPGCGLRNLASTLRISLQQRRSLKALDMPEAPEVLEAPEVPEVLEVLEEAPEAEEVLELWAVPEMPEVLEVPASVVQHLPWKLEASKSMESMASRPSTGALTGSLPVVRDKDSDGLSI